MADVVHSFRAAARLEDCLETLSETRKLTKFAIVGFKEGHDAPGIARMPRPHYWTERFGWPPDFLRDWLQLNVAGGSLMPDIARARPGVVISWAVPDPDDPLEKTNLSPDQLLSARFLRAHAIDFVITATCARANGLLGQVSWLRPLDLASGQRSSTHSECLLLAQLFFDALDRICSSTARDLLTDRELQCLSWVAYGYSDKEIAQEIGCAHDTVRFHIKNIVRKLGAANRTHAVALAIQAGTIRLGARPKRWMPA